MKKAILVLALVFTTLFGGICLTGCQNDFDVTIQKASAGADLYDIVLVQKNQELEQKNTYNFPLDTDILVQIRAKRDGVDFSGLKVKRNGQDCTVFEYTDFTVFGEKHNYGWVTLPKINEDVVLEFSGVKNLDVTYHFENALGLPDQAKIDLTSVNFGTQYQKLAEIFENSTAITKSFATTAQDAYSFKVKFDHVRPINVSNSSPFKIKSGATAVDFETSTFADNEFTFVLPSRFYGQKDVTIVCDFAQAQYQTYSVILPDNNQTYTISANSSVSFDQALEITVTKIRAEADFTNIKVFANEIECTKTSEQANEFKFTLAANNCPYESGNTNYKIYVKGITYGDTQTFAYDVESEVPGVYARLFEVGDDDRQLGVSALDDDGNPILLSGKKYKLTWTNRDDTNYALYDGDTLLFNFSQLLTDQQEVIQSSDQNGFELKATYDQDHSLFRCEVTFTCSKEVNFKFKPIQNEP